MPFAHQKQVELFKGFDYGDMEAQDDKTLAFNAFKDPCLSLTKKQVELCKGFDYEDMEAQDDKTLAFNAFKDPCPSLTESRLCSARDSIRGT